ncbi:DUF5009 domain-containing protein [Shewanella sp. SNU WT4]|uniref:transmembrane glucosamine N-acetyltransferase NagX n=1 Tax=Shewanella sp. SNU WT4 TaxID=2590015 RepID=UPI00112761C3|nr:DUF5009 domain-containing protein [Shewanella sp. SNU WT4]QDF66376.1 DUF5009 domain-containing protein [Shewanella sp. SNU WT4]
MSQGQTQDALPPITPADKPRTRLKSLDALRGFDMFWILGGEAIFAALFVLTSWRGFEWLDGQMHHSQWHGFSFYDLIFPLFIFLSGVALGLSAKRLDALPLASRYPYYRHALTRLSLLIVLGIIYNHGWGSGMPASPEQVRYASVLARIAFAWFFTAMIVWHTSIRSQYWLAAIALIAYTFLQLSFGANAFTAEGSINAWVDTHWLPGITYQNLPYDPEGLLSTLPAIINALVGVFVGRFVKQQASPKRLLLTLLFAGSALIIIGILLSPWIPINKSLWTMTFSLVTIGSSILLLALFYGLVDVLNWQRFGWFFAVIGTNAIVIYLASSLVQWRYVADSLFGGFIQAAPELWQPLLMAISLLTVQWLLLRWLYNRQLFIKV